LDTVASLTSLATGDISSTWEKLKELGLQISINDSRSKSWYPRVQFLRWEATTVKTKEDYEKKILPIWEKVLQDGGNFSAALAIVLMDIIKNCPDKTVKKLAFDGGNGGAGLIHLLTLKNVDGKNQSIDVIRTRIKKERGDRNWETRQIVGHFLGKLARKDKYIEFNNDSRSVIEKRLIELREKPKDSRRKEQEGLETRLQEIERYRQILERELGDLRVKTRGTRAGGDNQKELAEIDEKSKIHKELMKSKNEINNQLDVLKDPGLEVAAEALQNEEAILLKFLVEEIADASE